MYKAVNEPKVDQSKMDTIDALNANMRDIEGLVALSNIRRQRVELDILHCKRRIYEVIEQIHSERAATREVVAEIKNSSKINKQFLLEKLTKSKGLLDASEESLVEIQSELRSHQESKDTEMQSIHSELNIRKNKLNQIAFDFGYDLQAILEYVTSQINH